MSAPDAIVQGVLSFIEGAIQAGFVTREQVKRLWAHDYLPCIMWRKTNVGAGTSTLCSTSEALQNIQIELVEKASKDKGICPRCKAITSPHERDNRRGQLFHKPDCPDWRPLR